MMKLVQYYSTSQSSYIIQTKRPCFVLSGLVEFSRDNFQLNPQFGSFVSIDAQSSDRNLNVTLQKKFYSGYLNVADLLSSKLTYARLDGGRAVKDVANSRNRLTITSGEVLEVLYLCYRCIHVVTAVPLYCFLSRRGAG